MSLVACAPPPPSLEAPVIEASEPAPASLPPDAVEASPPDCEDSFCPRFGVSAPRCAEVCAMPCEDWDRFGVDVEACQRFKRGE